MIKAENVGTGIAVKMSGTATDLLEELTAIIRGVKTNFDDSFEPEITDLLIAYAGKLAFADEEERSDILDEVIKILEEHHLVEVVE